MTQQQLIKNLQVPQGIVDVVLDTDAYNEIDDQFAIAYMLLSPERLRVKQLYAAPFHNKKSTSPEDGMERSYNEILKVLDLAGRGELKEQTYRGSRTYLPSETEPVESPAARALVELSKNYSADNPLYVVAIGAITNVASAVLMDPTIADRIVLSWLGGTSHDMPNNREFNLRQDIAAARVVFASGMPVVQLPCRGVVDAFTVSGAELEKWLIGKNPLADYLARNTIAEAESYAAGRPWTRVIWDVTAVAWLLNDGERFMATRLVPAVIPQYDDHYSFDANRHFMRYVYWINRDGLMNELFKKLLG
ncbi:MAG: nucleoside hydrolase [Ruminococcaceae bacterium]|nr:nucleoside hydrolase [Oscillospiraceae bacterium]